MYDPGIPSMNFDPMTLSYMNGVSADMNNEMTGGPGDQGRPSPPKQKEPTDEPEKNLFDTKKLIFIIGLFVLLYYVVKSMK